MAYRLKNVRYQGNDRKILLQNENGPCPLLAAANALLLRGAIHLPSICIRNGCASLEEVVNMLAEKAMNYSHTPTTTKTKTMTPVTEKKPSGDDSSKSNNNSNKDDEDDDTSDTIKNEKENNTHKEAEEDDHHMMLTKEQYVHDVLDVLPKLQYGMDVNPKFTNGPTGMEFTAELTTFDLLNVKMVHGWLLDPQSTELLPIIGSKTYNELVEMVIHGNEASAELHKLEEQLRKLEQCSDDDWIQIGVPANTTTTAADDNNVERNSKDDNNTEGGQGEIPAPKKLETKQQSVGELRATFREKQEDLSHKATVGSLVNNFLEHTGHQLTQYGLTVLYEHLAENELCVFFRNNHFSTLTKHQGLLYLLVTDLGYANVPNVVWEKLDVIDGDTEYVDAAFSRPPPHAELSATGQSKAGYNLDPEQLLAQRGQSEADYQLALQLSGMQESTTGTAADTSSGGGGGGGKTGTDNNNNKATIATLNSNLDEQEGQLMAAATEASLRTYNGVDDGLTAAQKLHHNDSTTQEDRDHLLAMQMQADMEQQDLRLAQQMQETEWAQQRQERMNANRATATTGPAGAKASNCVIS